MSVCDVCKSMSDLYGSNCKHLTLCVPCGKSMAENRTKCYDCGATITRLIREYNVRASNKNYFIGRFASGLPNFSKKNKWCIQKYGLQGRHAPKEKYENKSWVLDDETGQSQYHGVVEGAASATYYLLMLRGKEFVAIPAASWYNFNKVARYKQLTLEEAEEKMESRRKTAHGGYERWMMKAAAAANNGATAFGQVEKFDEKESGGGGGRGRKKTTGDNDDDEAKDEEELARQNRLGGDDYEEGLRGGDFDFDDDDDIEKGDDWEHEEVFTDDDERVENDREEREDLGPHIPAPPEIKQDEEGEEEEGGLSNSGKELKKLLGRTNGLNESDAEDYDGEEDEISASPVLAPKQKDAPKEEPVDDSPLKPISSATARGASSTSKSAKGKRKVSSDDAMAATVVPSKKTKTENDVKEEAVSTSKKNAAGASSVAGPVTEDEIRAVLTQEKPVTTKDLVAKFESRLRRKEDRDAFALILKRISKIQNTTNGKSLVLR